MDDKPKKRKKKPNKAQRDKIRAAKADTWKDGFNYGYHMGYEQGRRDTIGNAIKADEGLY